MVPQNHLLEWLANLSINHDQVEDELGLDVGELTRICEGELRINDRMAQKLEQMTTIHADHWLAKADYRTKDRRGNSNES